MSYLTTNATNGIFSFELPKNVIPTKFESENIIKSVGGDLARDMSLRFMLDNEVGNRLELQEFEGNVVVSLVSKSGSVLSTVSIDTITSVLFDTTANWDSKPYLISQAGVFYVYTDKYSYIDDEGNIRYTPGIKIGDGNAYLIDKPFLLEDAERKLVEHLTDMTLHVSPEDRDRWDNKLNYIEPSDNNDLLEFTRT